MSIRQTLKRFYVPLGTQGEFIDRNGLIRALAQQRTILLIFLVLIFVLVFSAAAAGLWLALNGKLPNTGPTSFLGGASFLVLIEILRRLIREWSYVNLVLISAASGDEAQLRSVMEMLGQLLGSADKRAEKTKGTPRTRRSDAAKT